jgi:hypothetical protein
MRLGVGTYGSKAAFARHLGVPVSSFKDEWSRRGLSAPGERSGVVIVGDEATVTSDASVDLGDIDALVRDRGLDPSEWIVTGTVVNEWDALSADGRVRLRQLKVTLKRRVALLLVSPAVHVPPVRNMRAVQSGSDPEYVVIESDHQAPYHDPRLHEASLALLAKIQPNEHIFLGDLADFPTISRFRDHPAAMAAVNECIQGGYNILRDKAEASPGSVRRKLKGNHDYRIEAELLGRAERMYDIRPADTGDGEELPALSLRRLLHLDAMGYELVEDVRGWEHAEIEIVPGPLGLVARHGWLTGANTALRSLKKRGRSIVCGHTHGREHTFMFDPSMGCERQAAVIGCMCSVRGEQSFPHFAICDEWLQGFAVVSRWPDGRFLIEHARWDGEVLNWRTERIAA